jgi:predicted AAA+ superfamily ATPase
MITRILQSELRDAATQYPVVTVTGPRQSGKTTLCRQTFPRKPYLSLEAYDVRQRALEDPRALLADLPEGAILDEIQHTPDLPSYLQGIVDEDPTPGRFVLTGSQHFGLAATVSQSLAGRTAVLHLLPCSHPEVRAFGSPPDQLGETLWTGGYPRIHDRGIPADRWLADYVTTYVQRDVHQLLRVGDLHTFTTFVRLCAGRTGQVLNLSALADDAGITHNTARSWLSVLEASFLVFRLPPWRRNIKKQLTKAPKLHFLDTGLACHLLGVRTAAELWLHPLRGAIFETWVVSEVYKSFAHRGMTPPLFYFRDHKGLEIDLIVERGDRVELVECKSGTTVAGDAFRSLERVDALLTRAEEWRRVTCTLVYGGPERQQRSNALVLPWRRVNEL